MKKSIFPDVLRIRRRAGAIVISALAAIAACATLAPPDINLAKDFTTTGFLDETTMQVIVTVEPDKSVKGLVARRDSALKNAEKRLAELVTGGIADFRISRCVQEMKGTPPPGQQGSILKKTIMDASRPLLQQGKRVAEYYREDESLVIVYRITKSGIKNDIDGLGCEAGQTDPVENKNSGGPR
jgi:hypothetical protein